MVVARQAGNDSPHPRAPKEQQSRSQAVGELIQIRGMVRPWNVITPAPDDECTPNDGRG